MCASVFPIAIVLASLNVYLSSCVSVNRFMPNDIVSKTKYKLPSLFIECSLNDMVIISAPILNSNIIYRLYKPNGDIKDLNIISRSNYLPFETVDNYVIVHNFEGTNRTVAFPLNNHKVFNVNTESRQDLYNSILEDNTAKMNDNDFMIGPLVEEDHGNWCLSLFEKVGGDWTEIYQIITIKITEYIRTDREHRIKKGDTFTFGFDYPIAGLESCELIAPKSTFDRWFDRDQNNLDSCIFVLKNVTKQDGGLWKVIGVGRIVYETRTFLHVL